MTHLENILSETAQILPAKDDDGILLGWCVQFSMET